MLIATVRAWKDDHETGAKVRTFETVPEMRHAAKALEMGKRCAAWIPIATALGALYWRQCKRRPGIKRFCFAHRDGAKNATRKTKAKEE